jgi:1-acyl-sn-glycerol-3-phosphate acyltransferase
MGKDTLWKSKLGWYLSALGGFPVVRGTADREALRACQAILDRGEPLVMFPEGTRHSGEAVAELFDGPAFLAARTGAPIIPIGIGGTEGIMPKGSKFIRPRKVTVVVGEPIVPPPPEGRVPRRVVRELTDRLHKDLQAAFDATGDRSPH